MKYKIDVMLDEGAYLPERAHILDAGMDLRSRENKVISEMVCLQKSLIGRQRMQSQKAWIFLTWEMSLKKKF